MWADRPCRPIDEPATVQWLLFVAISKGASSRDQRIEMVRPAGRLDPVDAFAQVSRVLPDPGELFRELPLDLRRGARIVRDGALRGRLSRPRDGLRVRMNGP